MERDHNIIPLITHPYGSAWSQPQRERIEIDDTHAMMDEATFCMLAEYSCTSPSGVYKGKMWKSKIQGKWWLRWYGHSENPVCCSNNGREIIVVT